MASRSPFQLIKELFPQFRGKVKNNVSHQDNHYPPK